jgi:hypothetical protein
MKRNRANPVTENDRDCGKDIKADHVPKLYISKDFDEEAARAVSIATFLGFVVLAVYLKTAFPTVPSGDAGELCFTSCALGVAHPPGYPLFIMLGFVFTKIIPFGSPAFRVNCVSCCCGALAGAQNKFTAFNGFK